MREVVAADLVDEDDVNDHMPTIIEVDVLDDKIAATSLAVRLAHRGKVVSLCGQAQVMTDLLQIVSSASFVLPLCFLQV